MSEKLTPQSIMEELITRALHQGFMIGSPDGHALKYAIAEHNKTGKEIPEHLLPGALIKRLSPEKREVLKGFTSEMALDMQNPHSYYGGSGKKRGGRSAQAKERKTKK